MVAHASSPLSRLLAPVTNCLNREAAEQLSHLQIDPATQARIDELARKANEGTLTVLERAEYLDYIDAMDLIGILQHKAKEALLPPASR